MIHYHGTPISGNQDEAMKFLRGRHAFVSFSAPSQLPIVAEVCSTFAIDNGAFSAWRKKQSYDFSGYADFVGEWRNHPGFDWAIIPDVIDGTEKQNDDLLYSWPFDSASSVPVWHLHESIDRFARLCRSYPRVALGSSGKYANPGTDEWWGRIDEALRIICERNFRKPICKLHGLRMLNPKLFTKMPLSSADSTNVARNCMFSKRWDKVYSPMSQSLRAIVLAERIESYQSSPTWNPIAKPNQLEFSWETQ